MLLRAAFLVDAVGLNKVQGQPFLVSEIEAKIEEMLRRCRLARLCPLRATVGVGGERSRPHARLPTPVQAGKSYLPTTR